MENKNDLQTSELSKAKKPLVMILCYAIAALLVLGAIGGTIAMAFASNTKEVNINFTDYSKESIYNKDIFYKNPMVQHVADPQIIQAEDGYYYLYATSLNMDCYGYSVWRSNNLVDWDEPVECFTPNPNEWGKRNFWAPEVIEIQNEDGSYKYYMHYSADDSSGKARVGVATSDSPMGPFINLNTYHGANNGRLLTKENWDDANSDIILLDMNIIDAHLFSDEDGKNYIYFVERFKASSGYENLRIYGSEIDKDYVTLLTKPKMLLSPSPEDGMNQDWEEEGVNEGPAMIKHNGIYYLTYSGNGYTHAYYGLGYATSNSPLGDFEKFDYNPVLVKNTYLDNPTGTGHHGVLKLKNGEWYSIFHSHIDINTSKDDRQMNIGKIGFRENGDLYINGPILAPVLLPDILTPYKNLALNAKGVTVSSDKAGGNLKALTDGEIVVSASAYYENFLYYSIDKDQDFYDTGTNGMNTITFLFDEKIIAKAFAIYAHNIENDRFPVKIILDDKYIIDKVYFGSDLGHAAIAEIGERYVQKVQFVFSQDVPIRLSEIMVIGR